VSVRKITRPDKGTCYVARWWENGRKRQATCRTKKQAEDAERLGKDRQRACKHGLPFEAEQIIYDELCDRYLAQHQVSPRTIRTLEERLAYSRKAFGGLRVRELRPEAISRWNAALPLASTTRGHALRAVRQVCTAAVRWGYLTRNPAGPDAVPMPTPTVTEITPLESWEQVEAIAMNARWFGPLVIFACATGLRPQEWQALRWSDLDLANRSCRVTRTVQDGRIAPVGKTDGSLRTIVLQQRALDALAELPRPLDSRLLVFPAPEGGIVNLSNFRKRVWRPALEAAGLDYRPLYECRHTFATLCLSAGVPIEWISKQMGHTSIRTTLKHYARFLPAADARALDALDSFERRHPASNGREMDARFHG
jgi:integrase